MLLKFKPLKWASPVPILHPSVFGRGANIWDKTTQISIHWAISPLSSSAFPEGQQAWYLTWSQANCLFPQLETLCTLMGKTGNDWNCVWFDNSLEWERETSTSSARMMSENLALGSTLNSLPIWLDWVQT